MKSASKISTFSSESASTSGTPKSNDLGLSPAPIPRLQEKEGLQHLNDRLAAYIDKVRHVELENDRLMVQIHSSEETVKKEMICTKNIYEYKLTEARKLIDELSKDKAKMQVEAGKYKNGMNDISIKLGRKESELRGAEKLVANLEGQLNDLRGKYNTLLTEKKKLEEDNKQYRLDNLSLEKQVEYGRQMRVDLENRLRNLQGDLDLKINVYEKEILEVRTREKTAIREIDDQLQKDYEHKLEDALKDMRLQNTSLIQRARQEVEQMYQAKLADLQSASDLKTDSNNMLREEVHRYRSHSEELLSKIKGLEAQLLSANSRVQELEKGLLLDKADHERSLRSRDQEIGRLRETMSHYVQELDMDLVAYRKMLEGEEDRLKSPSRTSLSHASTEKSASDASYTKAESAPESGASTSTPAIGAHKSSDSSHTAGIPSGACAFSRLPKRPVHYSIEENSSGTSFKGMQGSSGDLEIVENSLGACAEIIIKSDKDIPMMIITMKRGEKEATHKLYRRCNLKTGEVGTVWCSNPHACHDPSKDIVIRNQNSLTDNYYSTQESHWREFNLFIIMSLTLYLVMHFPTYSPLILTFNVFMLAVTDQLIFWVPILLIVTILEGSRKAAHESHDSKDVPSLTKRHK